MRTRGFKFANKKNPTGFSIAICIFAWANSGTGSTNDRGRMSNGNNTQLRRSCGHSGRTTTTHASAITNYGVTLKAELRSRTLDYYWNLLAVVWAARC